MSSFFKRFFSKPPGTRRTLERARDTYGSADAAIGTAKAIYSVGKLGPAGAARAAFQSFTVDSDVAFLKVKVIKLEKSLEQRSVEMEEMKSAGAEEAIKMKAALDTLVQKCKAMEEEILQFKKQMVKMEEKKSGKK